MGKVAWNLTVAALLAVASLLSPLPGGASQAGPPVPCNGQPVASPSPGHYTGSLRSDGDYHFSAFNTDIDLKITINGTVDGMVGVDGQFSGTVTGNVDAPIFHDGRQDVSSGIGTMSGTVTGTLAGSGVALTLAHPVIDMHWGTFGGHAIERFITMPDYQLPVTSMDCVSGKGTIVERDFPVQTIVPDGVSANPVQVPGIGAAGGAWQLGSDRTEAFNGLSRQVDSFIERANKVLDDSSVTLTPSVVEEQIAGPLRTLEAVIEGEPDISRCLLERLGAWEVTAGPVLLNRAHDLIGMSDLLSLRRAADLVRSASLVSPDCQVSDGVSAALLEEERQRLDRAIAVRAWSDAALWMREVLLVGGAAAQKPLQQQVDEDLRRLSESTNDARALLDVARLAYALGDDEVATAVVRRLVGHRTVRWVRSERPVKHRKHKKNGALPPGVKPAKPNATPIPTAAPKTLDQILASGVASLETATPAGSPPEFRWGTTTGAARYVVLVTTSGATSPLWSWSGTETSARYGDTAIQGAADTASDGWQLRLAETGYRWSVIALDAGGRVVGLRLRAGS